MDTQGCFEQQTTNQQQNQSNANTTTSNSSNTNNINTHYGIMALSTMLSCVQFYNMNEGIAEESINALKFFTDYEKLSALEAPQFSKSFQVKKNLIVYISQ